MGTKPASELNLDLSREHESAIRDVWKKILGGWGEDYGNNQSRKILSAWHPILLKRAGNAIKDNYSSTDDIIHAFENECVVAEEVLTEVRDALLYHVTHEWKKKTRGMLWFVPSHLDVNTQPDYWTHISPVHESRLKQATARYLEKPWLQHNLIDWAIINASLFNQVAELGDGLKSGQLLGKLNRGYLIAGNKLEKLLLWKIGIALLGFLARWIIPPAAAIVLLVLKYEKAAAILGGLWAVYVLLRFVGLIVGRGERKALRTRAKKYVEILDALIAVWLFTNSEVINPKRLRELLVEVDQRSVVVGVPAVVYSLVDRAIERDPAVLTHSVRY